MGGVPCSANRADTGDHRHRIDTGQLYVPLLIINFQDFFELTENNENFQKYICCTSWKFLGIPKNFYFLSQKTDKILQ